jgi:hypothetical protein
MIPVLVSTVVILALACAALIAALTAAWDARDDARRDDAHLGEEIDLYRDAAHRGNTSARWR